MKRKKPDMIMEDSKDKLVLSFPQNKVKITWNNKYEKGIIEGL